MNIPLQFKTILRKDATHEGVVTYTIAQFSKILAENKLFFFEEYTDHGVDHISAVLCLSAKLIKEETYRNILDESPLSVAVYILSVILHDIGMHLTNEGFHALVNGANDDIRIRELDPKTWKERWEDYLDEVRRFGSKEKMQIIGNADWIFRVPATANRDQLTGEDKKLIGEFIRRHHPRIAHEIAINGFPTAGNNLPFAVGMEPAIRDICGLLARSHGIEIRNTFEYLEDKFPSSWVKPYNIELIFLMVVLRISDYFQITAERTPTILVKLKRFYSPISKMEFDNHLDVKYSQPYAKDPETIVFHCEPSNNLVYIKLKDLLSDIQRELDQSWAILGEAYGKNTKDQQPELMYRRVKSDIDIFAQKRNYVPEKIKFEVSTELPKLLVSPLYGNDPSYAIRELLQNSVDACRERAFLEGNDYKGIVRITFSKHNDQFLFEITDNGTGMSLNTIKNYFLKIGSSFRNSTQWKKDYLDEGGRSRIERSGKFGIGVLSVFLLGDKIVLETKEAKSAYGYAFETDLSTEYIEVNKIAREETGTTIRVAIDQSTIDALQRSDFAFDLWYTQTSPEVIYEDNTGSFANLGYKKYTPGYHDELPVDWYELPQQQFKKVLWSFSRQHAKGEYGYNSYINAGEVQDKLHLSCNGIIIPQVASPFGKYMPIVAVFDFDGLLPLNLNRNSLDGQLPFMNELLDDINRYFIAKFLFGEVSNPFSDNVTSLEQRMISHPLDVNIGFAYARSGFILKTRYFIDKNKYGTYLQFSADDANAFPNDLDCENAFVSVKGDLRDLGVLCSGSNGIRLLTGKGYYENLMRTVRGMYGSILFDEVQSEDDVMECRKNYTATAVPRKQLLRYLKAHTYVFESAVNERIIDISFKKELKKILPLEDSLSAMLSYYLNGKNVIPYDIGEREKVFGKAFKELKPYWEKQMKKKFEYAG